MSDLHLRNAEIALKAACELRHERMAVLAGRLRDEQGEAAPTAIRDKALLAEIREADDAIQLLIHIVLQELAECNE